MFFSPGENPLIHGRTPCGCGHESSRLVLCYRLDSSKNANESRHSGPLKCSRLCGCRIFYL